MSYTYVVGDVHGAGEELQALLEQVKFNYAQGDKLYLVGDVFDRGRHGHLVWNIIQKYKAVVTRGNHEQKFIKFFQGRNTSLPPHYYWAMNNLLAHGVTVNEFVEFLNSTPLLVEAVPGTIVTHAGVNVIEPYKIEEGANVYGHLVPEQKGNKLYWWDHYKGKPLVLYGHLVCDSHKARYRHNAAGEVNSIGLDTAAVHGGPVTAYCLETKEIHQYSSGVGHFVLLKEEFKKQYQAPNAAFVEWIRKNTNYKAFAPK